MWGATNKTKSKENFRKIFTRKGFAKYRKKLETFGKPFAKKNTIAKMKRMDWKERQKLRRAAGGK